MFKNLKPAGVLALVVVSVLGLSALGWLGRVVVPDSPQAMPTLAPTATGQPTSTIPPTPALDTEAAWETFMQAVYLADALPDRGSDLSQYPPSQEALSAGLTDVTTDTVWINWGTQPNPDCVAAGYQCWMRRLAEFGPRQLQCEGMVCVASVSVTSVGIYGFWEGVTGPQLHRQAEHPEWTDPVPFRLLVGKVAYHPEIARWIVTEMTVTVLPALPEYTTP